MMMQGLYAQCSSFVPQPPMPAVIEEPPPEPQPIILPGNDTGQKMPQRSEVDDKVYKKKVNSAQKEHDRRVAEKNRIRRERYDAAMAAKKAAKSAK